MATATETLGDVPARVARGATWLDAHEPGWVDRIDLEILYLSSPCQCVAGQLAGDFSDFLDKHDLGLDALRGLGFMLSSHDLGVFTYSGLTAAWKHVIAGRREGGGA